MSKNAKKTNSTKTVENLRKAQSPSLKDLVAGKSDNVAKAVAEHSAKKLAAEAPVKKGNHRADTKAAKKGAAKEKKVRAPGSGTRIKELLAKGMDADKILSTIHKEFPGSTATKGDIAWNKWDMKRKGEKLPA